MFYLSSGQKLNFFDMKNNNTILRSVLLRFGLVHVEKFVQGCGKILRVKNFMFATDGLGDKFQVTLSGYITPSLQIRYGLGVFDSLTTITARYRLFLNLYFEVISGKTKIADLVYQFKY